MKAHDLTTTVSGNQESISSLKEEYDKRLRLASMSDEELFQCAVTRLRKSYEVYDEPFHPYHDEVDLVREECERRDRLCLFDKAFREI